MFKSAEIRQKATERAARIIQNGGFVALKREDVLAALEHAKDAADHELVDKLNHYLEESSK